MKIFKTKVLFGAALIALSVATIKAAIIPIGGGPAVIPISGTAEIITVVNGNGIANTGSVLGNIADGSLANDASLSLSVNGSIALSSDTVSSLSLTASAAGLTETLIPGTKIKNYSKNGVSVSVSLNGGAAVQVLGSFAFDGLAKKGTLSVNINGVSTTINVPQLKLIAY